MRSPHLRFIRRYMRWMSSERSLKLAVVAVAVIAWIAATNHCLLGVTTHLGNEVVSGCHCSTHAEKTSHSGSGPASMLACCQGLQSTNSELAKLEVSYYPRLDAIQLFVLPAPRVEGAKQILPVNDSSPPLAGSFIGTVLRRSLPKNAPPITT